MRPTGARILDGDRAAERYLAQLEARVSALAARGTVPKLVTILVGDDPASAAYIGRKHDTCAALGIASEDIRLSGTIGQAALLDLVTEKDADSEVDGVLVQLPLPPGFDSARIGTAISPDKDVDGLHPVNLGRLLAGTPGLLPCTPAGVLQLLRAYEVPLAARRVALIGRGMLVGRPLAMLLSLKGVDADVTILHSQSSDPGAVTRAADVVISAVGRPDFVDASMIRPGAAVVGVGISYDATGRMVSDIADDVAGVAGAVTPRHGSVGALTRAMLMENLLTIASGRATD